MDKQILTTKEAARYLGVEKSTMLKYINQKLIKPVDYKQVTSATPTYLFAIEDLDGLKDRVAYNKGKKAAPPIREIGEGFIPTAQAAKYLGVSQATLNRYVEKGLLNVIRQKDGIRMPRFYALEELESLKAKSVIKNPVSYTSKGRSAYVVKKHGWPDEDEVHPSGAIIYWSRVIWGGYAKVPIKCASCGEESLKYISHLKEAVKRGEFTGCCVYCYQANRKPRNLPSNGMIINMRRDGYIYRHKRTFMEEEWEILKEMNPTSGKYIAEHRAVMALHLGRPLTPTESVHHINGIKTDNSIGNLEVLDAPDHAKFHQGQLRKIAGFKKRIKELEEENKRLKELLGNV